MDASQFSGGDEKKEKEYLILTKCEGRLVSGWVGGWGESIHAPKFPYRHIILSRSISMLFVDIPSLQASISSKAGWTPFDKRNAHIQMSVLKVKLA